MRTWLFGSRVGLAALALPLLGVGCAFEEVGDAGEAELDQLESLDDSWGRDPVIFVHGCSPPEITDAQAVHLFDPMKAFFLDRGYPEEYLVSFQNMGPQCQSNAAFASQLSTLVQDTLAATGTDKVDIVAHSMGALATRLYITQDGAPFVRDVVFVAGANHGGEGASAGVFLQSIFGFPAFEGMQEMYPPYACQGQASGQPTADVQFDLNGCLTAKGRTVKRDETPGEPGVQYRSIRNLQDEIVVPVGSACLNQRWQNDCADTVVNRSVSVPPGPGPCGPSGCPAHVTVLFSPTVHDLTFRAVNARGAPAF